MRRALLTAALVLLFAAPAQAATFQVTTNVDSATCNAVACSLRGAVAAAVANGVAEDDVINVPPGVYQTPEVSMSGANASGITIAGSGANTTFWEPAATNRLLNVSGTFTPTTTVTIRDLTMRNGLPATGAGGNLIVNGAQVTLQRVRVTNGRAAGGGGIQVTGSSGPATLTVLNSLIDNNTATTGNDGGGLISLAITNGATMSFQDSTIAFNTADRGGGVYMTSTNGITLRGATVAYNRARNGGTGGVGGIQSSTTQPATIQGSLFAANTTTINTGNQTLTPTLNCSFGTTTADGGGNVEDADQCGLGAGSRRNAVPELATELDATQQPPTLNIPETSPAIDFAACGTRTTDQRGMTRPLGANCDAGAYEFDPRPDTAIQGAAPPFTLTSSDAGSSFQCSLDGGAFVACATPYDPGAAPGTHTLTVRAVDAQGNIDPTPATTTFTVAAPAHPDPLALAHLDADADAGRQQARRCARAQGHDQGQAAGRAALHQPRCHPRHPGQLDGGLA